MQLADLPRTGASAAFAVVVLALAGCVGSEDSRRGTGDAITKTQPSVDPLSTGVTQTQPVSTVVITVEGVQPVPQPKTSRRRELASCPFRTFRLLFDRENGRAGVFDEAGRIAASASSASRDIDGDLCQGQRHRFPGRSDAPLPKSAYHSIGLACSAPAPIEIETHEVINGAGKVIGSVLTASLRESPVWLVSAITTTQIEGRRVYYVPRYCKPL